VFAEGQVDRFIVGDWRDVQVRLGLRPHSSARIDPAILKLSIQKVPPDPLIGSGESKGQPNQAASESRTQPRASSEPRTQPHNRSV
jgi:hypothetical protein